jgi:hypothetical protein
MPETNKRTSTAGALRREEDWKRITKLEMTQEAQQKELSQVVVLAERLDKRMKKISNIALGIAVAVVAQILGLKEAVALLIGLL